MTTETTHFGYRPSIDVNLHRIVVNKENKTRWEVFAARRYSGETAAYVLMPLPHPELIRTWRHYVVVLKQDLFDLYDFEEEE